MLAHGERRILTFNGADSGASPDSSRWSHLESREPPSEDILQRMIVPQLVELDIFLKALE